MKVAAGFLVFLAVSTAVVMSAEALRVRVLNMFIDTKEKLTDIDIFNDKERPPESISSIEEPTYVPIGYELTSTEEYSNQTTLIYENASGSSLVIRINKGDVKISVDTEDADYGEIIINGYEAFYSHKKGMTVLVVKRLDSSYSIVGEVNLEEARKIAESIK